MEVNQKLSQQYSILAFALKEIASPLILTPDMIWGIGVRKKSLETAGNSNVKV